MSAKPRELDRLLTRWIASEVIFHLKGTSYWSNPKYASKIKVHKIIYNVAEKFDLPITRSWYMHGGYIHDYDDLDKNYSSLVLRSIDSGRGPLIYRSKLKKIYPNLDEIIEYIKSISSDINQFKVNDYLNYIYNNESPKEYKNCYLSKFKFTKENNSISILSKCLSSYDKPNVSDVLLKIIDRIYDEITDYNISIYNTFSDNLLEKNSRLFFDCLEDSLRKFEIILKKHDTAPVIYFKYLEDFNELFINDIWRPFACEITKNTVNGPWSDRVIKNNVIIWRKESIKNFDIDIIRIKKILNNNNLKMSYKDIKNYYEIKNNENLKNIFSLISTYEKREE